MGIDEYMIRKGEKKGILKTKENAVREMLLDGKLSLSDISKYMKVPTSFVKKIKESRFS